jgi:hypothetical protein
VEDFKRNTGGVGVGDEGFGHRGQRDAHAARGRAGNAGQRGDGNRFIDQRIGNGAEGIGDHQKARQGGNHRTETVFGSGIHGRQQRAADRSLAAFGKLGHHGFPGKDEDRRNPDQQGAFDGPDRRNGLGLLHHRRDLADHRRNEGNLLAIKHRNGRGEYLVHDADHDQRQDRDQRMRQIFVLEGFRLVGMAFAITFTGRGSAATAPFEIAQATNQDEDGTDHAQPGSGVNVGLEEGGRDDVLDLRRAGQGIHREGEGAQRNRAGNQALGNAALTEHFSRKRIDREDHDKQRDAAVSQDGADDDDGEHRPLATDDLDHRGNNRLREAGEFNHLAEDRAEQEDGEEVFDEADHLVHEEAGKHRRHHVGVDKQDRAHCSNRREEDDAVAAVGYKHQKDQ